MNENLMNINDEELINLINEAKSKNATKGNPFQELIKEKGINIKTYGELEEELRNRGYVEKWCKGCDEDVTPILKRCDNKVIKRITLSVYEDVAKEWEEYINSLAFNNSSINSMLLTNALKYKPSKVTLEL